MKFKTQKINRSEGIWRLLISYLGVWGARLVLIFLGLLLVLGTVYGFKTFTQDGGVRNLIPTFGSLNMDEHGRVNFVLLGVGGKMEEGGNLSDSIMIVSVDTLNPSASLLSLPRDLFVHAEIGDYKINEVYARARYTSKDDQYGLKVVKKAVSELTGLEIHYSAVVSFALFEDVIDALGGIDLYVSRDIHDPFYPDEDYGFQTFIIRKGLQTLDGATSLKYVRSRKTSSDYDRAQRQQDVLLAIREKVADLNLFVRPDKIKSLYDTFARNVVTDVSFVDITHLAKIAPQIEYQNVQTSVLNDDPNQKGGLLYTPAKEFYGGQFVLLPENLSDTQLFMKLNLTHPEILNEKAQVRVLNGSKISGEASKLAARLRRLGIHVIEVGNYETDKPVFRSFARVYPERASQMTQAVLEEMLDLYEIQKIAPEDVKEGNLVDIDLIIGTN